MLKVKMHVNFKIINQRGLNLPFEHRKVNNRIVGQMITTKYVEAENRKVQEIRRLGTEETEIRESEEKRSIGPEFPSARSRDSAQSEIVTTIHCALRSSLVSLKHAEEKHRKLPGRARKRIWLELVAPTSK